MPPAKKPDKSVEQRLKDAEAKRKDAERILKRERASLEALTQGRERLLTILGNLGKGDESAAQKKVIAALKADVKSFAKRIAAARSDRAKQQSVLKSVRAAIARLKHRVGGGKKVMYDDVTVSLIPKDPDCAAAGYVNGIYANMDEIQAGPWSPTLSIAVSVSANAECLDVEMGDATNSQAPGWFKQSKGNRAFYTSISNAAALISTLAAAGIQRSEYALWTAHYNGKKHICTSACGYGFSGEADGTQWTDHSHGVSLDESFAKMSLFA